MNTVSGMFSKYLQRKRLSDSTLEVYGRGVRYFIDWIGDKIVADVTYVDADDYAAMVSKGRTPSAANTYLRGVRALFSWLAKRRDIDQNPFERVGLFRVGIKKKEVYAVDEVQRLIQVANAGWQVIILLALQGLREGEILNLILSDIDLGKHQVWITPKKDSDETWRWQIKDLDTAVIDLPEVLERLIVTLMESLPNACPYLCIPPKYYRQLIARHRQGTLPARKRNCPWGNFNRDFKDLCRRASVRYRTFHCLRDTFATVRYRLWDCDIEKLQKAMRHSSISTTAKYVQGIGNAQLNRDSVAVFDSQCYVT